jgi:hypothetical protein
MAADPLVPGAFFAKMPFFEECLSIRRGPVRRPK